MTGFFAGALVAHLVPWQSTAKALIAAGVCAIVTTLLLVAFPKKDNKPES